MGDDMLKLEPEEVELFKQPLWLNDNCVEFWLEHILAAEVAPSRRDEVCIIGPAAMHMTQFSSPEQTVELFKPLSLSSKELILLPVNDHTAPQEIGGSHWALLVYTRSSNTFTLYDSIAGRNRRPAMAAMGKMAKAIHAEGAKFEVETRSPQQTNGYDCGAVTCLVAGVVVRAHVNHKRKPVDDELSSVSPAATAQARRDVMKVAQQA